MKTFPRLVRFILLAGFTATVCVAEPEASKENQPQTNRPARNRARDPEMLAAAALKMERDVVYGKVGDVELKMDIYYPKTSSNKPTAAAMYVHGGGWQSGDKTMGAGAIAIPELLKRGYFVASINYRLAPEFKFPAQIEDAKCAVRFLRASAKKFNLDANRIGVWGGSAGGHLVALLGTADASAGFDTSGGSTNQSSRVQAVVDMFGPTDLTLRVGGGNARLGENVFGTKSLDDAVMKRASPVTYVSSDDPPFLILHGDQDKVVPLSQSEILKKRLDDVGVPAKLVVVKNAGHSFSPSGGQPEPSRAELTQMIADFFDRNLRKENSAAK